MHNIGYTRIPDLLIQTMKTADAVQAERLFEDAYLCADRMTALLFRMGEALEETRDTTDTPPEKLSDIGASLALTVEIIRGMYDVVDIYRQRQTAGELPALRGGRHV
ncbi:TPA: hypothetical protein NBK42_000563 [Klebsiella pneumoniae]|nr:hypothetical protein [Klebsiella pneumoniae]